MVSATTSRWAKRCAASLVAGLLVAGAWGAGAPPEARASARCGWSGYSYAGVESATRAHGIAATLSVISVPVVESGHVAGWVGVGGSGAGPGGADEWLQVGVTASAGSSSVLYYEFKRPGGAASLVRVAAVEPGERHRVAVLELASRRNWWRVWVDGRAASAPIFLPDSHGVWEPLATAETWDGGVPACNRYAFRFERVSISTRPGGGWRPLAKGYVLEDPGYRVIRRSPAAFVASARS